MPGFQFLCWVGGCGIAELSSLSPFLGCFRGEMAVKRVSTSLEGNLHIWVEPYVDIYHMSIANVDVLPHFKAWLQLWADVGPEVEDMPGRWRLTLERIDDDDRRI